MAAAIDEEVEGYIRRSNVALVATRSAKGHPFMTPLWFVLDGGALYIATGAQSWAFRNVAAHPEVTLLFGGERDTELVGMVRLRGRATSELGMPPARVLLRIAAKYYLPPRALAVELRHVAQWPQRMRYYGQTPGGAGYIRVVPTSAELLDRP